jgi:PQQ-like domain
VEAARVIELDLSAPWEPPEQPRSRRPLQAAFAVIVVLAAVLALFRPAPPAVPLGTAFALDGSGFVDMRNDGHTLYVLRQVDINTSLVDAYRLSDGRPVWSQRRSRINTMIDINRGMLLLHMPEPGSLSEDASVILALDVRDGHEVWRRSDFAPSFYSAISSAGVLVADPYVPGSADDQTEPERRSRTLVGLDIRTGATAWSLVTPPGTIRSYISQRDESGGYSYNISELDPDGTLRVMDAGTGGVRRTVHLHDAGPVAGFDIAGNLLTTFQSGPNGPQGVTVFDLVTGDKLWGEPPARQTVPMTWCGPVLCSDDGTGTTVVDPRTGRTLWRTEPTFHAWSLDDAHMVTVDDSATNGDWSTAGAVRDLVTGRVLRQLGGWQVVDATTWPTLVVLGRDGAEGGLVGLMDVTTGHTVVFGRMSKLYAEPTCQVQGPLFVCRSGVDLDAFRIPTWHS